MFTTERSAALPRRVGHTTTRPITTSRSLRSQVGTTGGFTVDMRRGTTPQRGISVCLRPSASLSFDWHRWDDTHVARWLADREAEGSVRCPYIGGWLDETTRRVWLDAVVVLPRGLRHAIRGAAAIRGERAYFDLEHGEVMAIRRRLS